jgi:hypothetical protein
MGAWWKFISLMNSCLLTFQGFLCFDIDLLFPVLSELGLSEVNTIILAFPSIPSSELTLELMMPIWKEAESFLLRGVAKEVGVADLMKDQLEELFNWASLKPKVDQINVAHCCRIPEVSVNFVSSGGGSTRPKWKQNHGLVMLMDLECIFAKL